MKASLTLLFSLALGPVTSLYHGRRTLFGNVLGSTALWTGANKPAQATARAPLPTWYLPGGVEIPILALNTAGLSLADTERSVKLAQAVGIRHVDFHPGTERDGVARVVAANKASGTKPLFLTTKIRAVSDPFVTPLAAADIARGQIFEDLRALGVGRIDLLLLRDSPNCDVMRAQWRVLEEALSMGRVRSIGTVNFCESRLRCLLDGDGAATVTPAVNYFMLHPGMGADAHGLRSFGESRGIKTFAYGVLGEPRPSEELLAGGGLLARLGTAHGERSPEEVAIRWALQSGVAVSARPTSEFGLGTSICRGGGSENLCAASLERRASTLDWELTALEMREVDALTSPDGEPCIFSRTCNPVLGSGQPGDPLLE